MIIKCVRVKIKTKANSGLKKNRTKGAWHHEKKKVITLIVAALAFTMTVCGSSTAIAASELTAESKPATQYTIDANQEVYALLDFEDTVHGLYDRISNPGLDLISILIEKIENVKGRPGKRK